MKTIVYIDAFNLYFGAVRNTPYRWLDLLAFSKLLLPNLEIHYGHFLTHPVKMRLANPKPGESIFVDVLKTEEKGSDVNLATHLLHDAHLDRYECAVVISGDSDLATPVQLVIKDLKKKVGVINPQKKACLKLLQVATFYKHIRERALIQSQFPQTLHDGDGDFTKPKEWQAG